MSRTRRNGLLGLAACVAVMLLAAPAQGAYHLMKIREVHEGGPSGDYVELQMYEAGQNFVSGHYLVTYDSGGNAFETFQFPSNAGNGQSQRSILVATAPTVNGVFADFVVSPTTNLLVGAGGSACFIDTLPSNGIDCVSWGTVSPPVTNPSPVGTPVLFGAGTALNPGQSIERTIARGCQTLLEAGDDTNDSAADFALATPSPRNNATAPTEVPCGPGGVPIRCRGKLATMVGTNGRDKLRGTNKRDVIAALGGKDKVNGRGGNDLICGEGARDVLIGGKGKDTLVGGAGPDRLLGGKGKDKLLGGKGRDVCNGGAGNDRARSCERPRRI